MEKPNPSNIRSYFKPTREASVSSRDVEKTEASSLASLALVVSIILAAYAFFSWSILAAILSVAALIIFFLFPSKKTLVKETVRESEERYTQYLFDKTNDEKASWGIYDDTNMTVFADFADGLIYFAGPATKSTGLSNHIFSIWNFCFRYRHSEERIKEPLEVVSYPTFANGNASVNGRVVPVTVQTGYKSHTTGGDYLTIARKIEFQLFEAVSVKNILSEKKESKNTKIQKNTGNIVNNEETILIMETDSNRRIKIHTPLSATLTNDEFKAFCNKVERIRLKYSSNYDDLEFRDGLVRLKER